jgi:hypothetical protein
MKTDISRPDPSLFTENKFERLRYCQTGENVQWEGKKLIFQDLTPILSEISRSDTSGGTLSGIATVDKGVLNYNDTTAVVGTTYYYKLRAKSGNDSSVYTNEVSGKRQ